MITSTRSEKNKNRIKLKKENKKYKSADFDSWIKWKFAIFPRNWRPDADGISQTLLTIVRHTRWRLRYRLVSNGGIQWPCEVAEKGRRERERGERGESRTGKCSLDLPLEQAAGRVQQEQPVARQCVYRIRPRRPVINFSESTGQWSRARSRRRRRRKDSNKRKYI